MKDEKRWPHSAPALAKWVDPPVRKPNPSGAYNPPVSLAQQARAQILVERDFVLEAATIAGINAAKETTPMAATKAFWQSMKDLTYPKMVER